jgi:molecular chaperone Hsp33
MTASFRAGDDRVLPFQVGDTAVRGRVVRLGSAIDEILAAHRFPAAASELVGEAAALATLMGSSLKFEGKLILQAQGDGPVAMLVADYSANGALRATASLRGPTGERFGLGPLVGAGHLALTIDQGPDMERYQGVVPLEGETLAEAAVEYFERSEQIPTAVKLAVGRTARPRLPDAWRAGGIMIQFMPGEGGARARGEAALKSEAEREIWTRAETLLQTTQADELLDPTLEPEDLLYRLYHEEGARVFASTPVLARCSCNAGKIEAVLERYAPKELADMIEDGAIRVRCDFCRAEYRFDVRGRELAP